MVEDFAPDALIAEKAGIVLKRFQVQVAFFLLGVVAVVAILLQERGDIFLEILGRGGGYARESPQHRNEWGWPGDIGA